MIIVLKSILLVAIPTSACFGQGLSDSEIQAAMNRGKTISAKKLWEEVKKKQQVRMNRAGFGDPIEKKLLLLTDRDRIALEAAEAKRQMREMTVEDIKNNIPLGVIEVLLEANCYNNLYAGSLPKWGPNGGVHVVLKIGEKVVQPMEKKAGRSDAVSIPSPMYRAAIYERASQRAWFTFPAMTESTFTVIAISGDGKQKEKVMDNPKK